MRIFAAATSACLLLVFLTGLAGAHPVHSHCEGAVPGPEYTIYRIYVGGDPLDSTVTFGGVTCIFFAFDETHSESPLGYAWVP